MKRFEWTLSRKLIGAAIVLVLFTSSTVELYFIHATRAAMERRLAEKVDFINKFYVNSIADALASQDDVRLLQDINRLEEDQEITSVVVVDQGGDIRYHADPAQMGLHLSDPAVDKALKSSEGSLTFTRNSGGKALVMVSPFRVKGSAAPLGAVRMELTYRAIQRQLETTKTNYLVFLLGLLMFCVGAVRMLAQRWLVDPLTQVRKILSVLNPLTMEPGFPEGPDDFGQIYKSLNELILKVRAELQNQLNASRETSDREQRLAESVALILDTDQRILIVDRDNRVAADTRPTAKIPSKTRPHLLDLITDNDFATLVANAFQKEGELLRGPVVFDDQAYDATVLRIPAQQSLNFRTLIALKPRTAVQH